MRLIEKYGSLKGKKTAEYVRGCPRSQYWIIENWAEFFKKKEVPYEVWERPGERGPERYLVKEHRNWSEAELRREGWNIRDRDEEAN